MPPKKKPGEEEEPVEEEKDLLEKELVISYLKSKLASYQEQSDTLRVDNYKLTEELEEQKSKLKDINEFLVNELKARALSFATLQAELTETKKTMEDNKTHFQSELKRITEESEKMIADLEERMADSDRKARSAEEYLGMREELLKEKASLQEQMQDMRTQFELQISEIERQHVQDRDKWKKTMAKRIQETKQYMIQLTDNQLELTTKRTIMENEQMSAEMAYQSHQTNSVLAQNYELDKRMAQLKRELSLSRDTQDELSKRNLVYQRAIKHLLVWLREHDGKEVVRDTEAASSDVLLTELQQELRRQELLAENRDADLAELRSKLAERDAEAAERARNVKDTSSFLLACMEDVKAKVVQLDTASEQKPCDSTFKLLPGQLKDLSQPQRERVLSFLFEQLLILEGPDSELLGLVRPTSSSFKLPDMKAASLSKRVDGLPLPVANPVAAAMDPQGANAAQKVPITPPPTIIGPYWGNTTGQVLHEMGTPNGAASNAFPPCMLVASTQTCDPQMESADRLLNKVMHDVRPWGRRAKSHPAVVKPETVKRGLLTQRPVNTSRGSLSTPTGPLPTNTVGGVNIQRNHLAGLDPAIASAVNANSVSNPRVSSAVAGEMHPAGSGAIRSSSRGTASRAGVASRGSRGAVGSRGTVGNLAGSHMGGMVDVVGDKLSEVQERGKTALLSHFKPGSLPVDV